MKFSRSQSLKQIADFLEIEFVGDSNYPALGINEIHVVEPGDIVFVDHPKYYDKALNSAASIILINKKVDCPEGKALLISEDPFTDFNKLSIHFSPFKKSNQVISNSAKIGKNTVVQPTSFIGNKVVIGDNCLIHPNVTLYDGTIIGNNVIIHAGTTLGSDAFYFQKRKKGFDKLISCGRVVIKDDVEIGAGCTIDRGVTGDTIIGAGSKLDNQIQVGHDTVIGEKCLIASQVGIAGCVKIENEVTLWGQVGIRSDITIGKGAVILGQTGVTKSVEGSKVYSGNPIQEARQQLKEIAFLRKQLKS